MVTDKQRLDIIAMIWFIMSIALSALFISAAAIGELTPMHLVITLILTGIPLVMTGFIWFGIKSSDDREKAKRENLEFALKNLSNTELKVLKERLAASEIDDEMLYVHLVDDGELMLEEEA